jgi:hypothetical protein
LVRVLEILQAEIRVAMGLLGVTRIDQLDRDYVCAMEPVLPMNDFGSIAWEAPRDSSKAVLFQE